MPTSTQRGFLTGKWELKYLRCRFRAHRNKVAAATPAIDSKMPPVRPHVIHKVKKAVCEERRQAQILAENFRILKKTSEIMNDEENIMCTNTHTPNSNKNLSPLLRTKTKTHGCFQLNSSERRTVHFATSATEAEIGSGSARLKRRENRPITSNMKRNYHIINGWFQIKFGKFVPWWAQISY